MQWLRHLKRVLSVVTYHPLLKSLCQIIYDNFYLLYTTDELKGLFTPGSMVSFRCSGTLSTYLVRAKCNRCRICKNVNQTDTFTSTFTEKPYRINHEYSFADKCLIFLLDLSPSVISATYNTWVKQRAYLDLDGIIITRIVVNMHAVNRHTGTFVWAFISVIDSI